MGQPGRNHQGAGVMRKREATFVSCGNLGGPAPQDKSEPNIFSRPFVAEALWLRCGGHGDNVNEDGGGCQIRSTTMTTMMTYDAERIFTSKFPFSRVSPGHSLPLFPPSPYSLPPLRPMLLSFPYPRSHTSSLNNMSSERKRMRVQSSATRIQRAWRCLRGTTHAANAIPNSVRERRTRMLTT